MHDELVHQRVVCIGGQDLLKALLHAARMHDDEARRVADHLAVREALDEGEALAGNGGEHGRGHVGALPPDEHEPVLEVRSGIEELPLALGVPPERGAAVEPAVQQRGRQRAVRDDGRLGLDSHALERRVDEIDREPGLPGHIRERGPRRGRQVQLPALRRPLNRYDTDGENRKENCGPPRRMVETWPHHSWNSLSVPVRLAGLRAAPLRLTAARIDRSPRTG